MIYFGKHNIALLAFSALVATTNAESATSDVPSKLCPTLHNDFMRRQMFFNPNNNGEPFTVEDGAKHTPFLALSEDGATATIVVNVRRRLRIRSRKPIVQSVLIVTILSNTKLPTFFVQKPPRFSIAPTAL